MARMKRNRMIVLVANSICCFNIQAMKTFQAVVTSRVNKGLRTS